jgi:coenzyme F420 biosynthesis associated uncharacterized protein
MQPGLEMVDWQLAVATARRLSPPGPALAPDQAQGVVRQLRALADEALDHVVAYTGLRPDPAQRTGTTVVDRGTWAEQNVAGLQVTLAPVLEHLASKRTKRVGHGPSAAVLGYAGRKVTGTELGGLLAFLSTKVLGQYEVFLPPADGGGRLTLVAPNIVEVERRLGVDPRDFRMWVCLHEQTHHVQFTGTPWLKDHLADLVRQLGVAADLDPVAVLGRVRDAMRERGVARDLPGGPLALLQSPEQRAVTADLQAVMTLLEGHADYVMDAVGPEVVPTVDEIRRGFEDRRRSGSPLERVARRLLGLDAKLAQYRIGGAFCRAVARDAGPDALLVAFAGPQNIPTAAEFANPAAWIERTCPVRA